ncbi:hypothetical protein ACWA5Z_05300 [Testudinibacter sp. P80/BLE/0925]|uniref:hypothetical protein n=1 Tax=Testudinibacter sp. TW-1 TaxID=3417757 RepID=UPI003D3653E2
MLIYIIKKIKEFFLWLTISERILLIFILIQLYFMTIPFLVFNDYNIGYKSYSNVSTQITEKEINGRLNNHKTIRQINNKCHINYCGLPVEGRYLLSSITFIKINTAEYIYSICTEQNKCLYNIDESFIEQEKNDINRNAKITLFGSLLGGIFIAVKHILQHRRRLSRKK